MRTWIVQPNLGNSRELRAISDACARIGARCLPVEVVPFDDSPLDLAGLDPDETVAYGTVRFVQRVHRQLGPSASLYDSSFNTVSYRRRWGANMLNQPAYVGPMLWLLDREIPEIDSIPGDEVFVRPVADLKSFSGVTVPKKALRSLAQSLVGTTVDIADDVEVSAAANIDIECRCWIVDGKMVAGVIYRAKGRRLSSNILSDEDSRDLSMMVEACARCWSPARAFVMDVCLLSGGDNRPKIVEAGCLTSAGFYNSGVVESVVRAVSEMPK